MARRQNRFFVELVAAIRAELDSLGVPSTVSHDGFPDPHPGLVYALVPPHEYMRLEGWRQSIPDELLRRTVFICAEQPGTSFFEDNVALAGRAAALFDINRGAVREFRRRGFPARHFQLGYTRLWDRMGGGDGERDVDVLFLGCFSDRRSLALARYASLLAPWRSELVISDNTRGPNPGRSANFLGDGEKDRLLCRSRVLLNIHQDEIPYFEWLRVAQAVLAGCVVVSEHSADHGPLEPGQHFLSGRPETLGHLAAMLLEDDERRRRMQRDAHELLRTEVPLRRAVQDLADAAEAARAMPLRATAGVPPASPDEPLDPMADQLALDQPLPLSKDPDLSVVRAAMKDLRLELLTLRRELRQLRVEAVDGPVALVGVERRSPAYDEAAPRVSVLTALYNHAEFIAAALDSVAGGTYGEVELIVVDDGSTDDSLDVARRWIDAHVGVPAMLLRHPVNRGLPYARNAALARARGEFCFVLDADNELYPRCLERLVSRLDDDPEAAFAYPMLERFTPDGPTGLLNYFGWQPSRFRVGNYIDAMALIRTDVLREFGGYTTDNRLYGWEDYDLWCRMAERGLYGLIERQVLARYRVAQHSMLSLTNLSTTIAYSLLAERCPTLMRGLVPPL